MSVILVFALLAALGFWVGLHETFGGYIWRKEMFFWLALIIGVIAAVLVRRQFRVHFAMPVGTFTLSMTIYCLGRAFGEAWYFGPEDAADLMRLVIMSMNHQL